jgi:PAS domain S-box-containing protein
MITRSKARPGPSPAFCRELVDNIPEAVIVTRPDGLVVWMNPAAERLLGYPASEVQGRSVAMLVPQQPDRRADAVKWLQRWASESDEAQSRLLDLIAQTKGGRQMPVDVRVVEAHLQGGAHYIITFRDNTARRKEQAAFKEANLRAARILQVAEDGIVSTDASQHITFFNLKAEAMFGYRAEEVIGKPLSMLIPGRYRAQHPSHVEGFGRGKQASRRMNERGTVWGLRKSGEEFQLEVAITKVTVGGERTYTAHMRDLARHRQSADSRPGAEVV